MFWSGIVIDKRDQLDRIFTHYAFSFILRGTGSFTVGGRTWPVRSPCVFTQRADEHFAYGPDDTWDERYIVYEPAVGDELRRLGFIDERRPIWYIGQPGPVIEALDVFAGLVERSDQPGIADRIDRAAEQCVLLSLLHQAPPEPDRRDSALTALRSLLEERCTERHHLDRLARGHGLAPATFRRLWQRRFGTSPARIQAEAVMRRACRLLAETDLPVATVAERLGFADPLYFSRRFRAVIGEPATAWRQRQRRAVFGG